MFENLNSSCLLMQKYADLGGPEFFFIVNFQVSLFQFVTFKTLCDHNLLQRNVM